MPKLLIIAMVALGGSVGAVSRYLLGGWVQHQSGRTFPWGTLTVNVVGCLLMGLLVPLLFQRVSPPYRSLVLIGMLGAFTTWSTFGLEAVSMISEGQFRHAAGYVVLTNVACLLSVWIGYRLSEQWVA